MSSANELVNSQVSASGEAASLAIEKFNGQVREAYVQQENLMGYFDLQEVTGTNMISNKYIGETQVQGMAAGQAPQGTEVEFDKNALVIDASLIARNIVAQLHDVQDDIGTKGRLASDQVKQLKKVEDRFILQQIVAGAVRNKQQEGNLTAANSRTNPRVKGHGFAHDYTLTDAGANDPWVVLSAIEYLLEKKQEAEVEPSDMAVAMTWSQFNALRDIERLVNTDYVTFAGDTRKGFTLKSFGVPVIPTNRLPKEGQDQALDSQGNSTGHHMLSNAANGYRYDATAVHAQAIAVVFGRDALIVGRSIALNGEIWRNPDNKSWYIDTFMAEGAIPDRWEHLGVIRQVNTPDDTRDVDITAIATARKARKAALTTTAS